MNLASIIDAHPDDQIALIEGDRAVTWAELRSLRDRTRDGLVAIGCRPGDRIAVVSPNSINAAVGNLAALSGGFVAVPISRAHPEVELTRQVTHVDATAVLTGCPLAMTLPIATYTPAGATVDGIDPLPQGPSTEPAAVDPDRVAMMFFTSGTAGMPKAAMLTSENLAFVQRFGTTGPDAELTADSVVLSALPFSHIYGMNVTLLASLRAGGTVVLQPEFHPAETLGLIDAHGVTTIAGVPPMWSALISHSVDRKLPAGLRLTSGAAALRIPLWTEFRDRFGIDIREAYGLTETASAVSSHTGYAVVAGSVGKPISGTEVMVVNHDDQPVPTQDSGRVLVRGPQVFIGYLNDEEATKLVLDDDGWLDTGDIGVFDDQGYLHLIDRAKDLIIVSGFNVYPLEVESVIEQHPAIQQAMVIGAPDERRGERVVAHVTVAEGSPPPTLDDLCDFARDGLARYKLPAELHVVEELPISPAGKLIRRALEQ